MNKILAFLLFTAILKAQDSVYIFQPVEIVAVKPVYHFQSFSILTSENFKNTQTLSLEESFSEIPGVIINDRNNPSLGDRISIRGIGARSSFGVRGIKIIADNIPLTLPDGQSQTNNIDLFSAGRIEILKGPASAFYGNSAGGVISINSQVPKNGLINIDPEIIFGSSEFQKYSLKLSGNYYSNSYLLSLNSLFYNGLRDHSSRKFYQLNTIVSSRFSDYFTLKTVINYFNSPYLLNPGSLDKSTLVKDRNSVREFNKMQGTGEKAEQFQTGATIFYSSRNFNLESTIYFIKRDVLNPIPGRIIDLKRLSGGIRSSALKKIYTGNLGLELSIGADIELQNDLRREFGNMGVNSLNPEPEEIFKSLKYGIKLIDQEEDVIGLAPFISFQLLINRNFGFLSGLRYDNYFFKVSDSYTNNSGERNMNKLSPSAGLFFKPVQNSKIYFNYSTTFQTPTTSELSNRPEGEGGFNPELKPESIYQFELGFNSLLTEINTSVSAALYYLHFRSLIIPYQIQNSEETFFRNAGKAENKGTEIKIESSISEKIKTILSYSLMDFKYTDYIALRENSLLQLAGNNVPGIPLQNAFFKIEYSNEEGFSGNINLSWADEYYTNDYNGAPPGINLPERNFINESYVRTDVRIAYNHSFDILKGIIFFGMNNVFDKKYNGSVIPNAAGDRFFEPAPGRNWYAGIRAEY